MRKLFLFGIFVIVIGFFYFNYQQSEQMEIEQNEQIGRKNRLIELINEYNLRNVDLDNARIELIKVSDFHLLRGKYEKRKQILNAQKQVESLREEIENIKSEIKMIDPHRRF